jgi:hypothetical protein
LKSHAALLVAGAAGRACRLIRSYAATARLSRKRGRATSGLHVVLRPPLLSSVSAACDDEQRAPLDRSCCGRLALPASMHVPGLRVFVPIAFRISPQCGAVSSIHPRYGSSDPAATTRVQAQSTNGSAGLIQRRGAPLGPISGLTRGPPSRWRSQFTPQPARRFPRFHRDKIDHALVNVIASGAFECSDVKAGRAGRDPCQHHFALRTWWSVKRAHDAVPYIRREHKGSQSPVDAVSGGDGEQSSTHAPRYTGQYRPHLGKVNEGKSAHSVPRPHRGCEKWPPTEAAFSPV